jgi:acetyl esterase/lipase
MCINYYTKFIHLSFVQLVLRAWTVYFSLHRIILGRSTGIHPDASLEYHALTSICWWTRVFPATIERMRFALNQLQVYHPPSRNIKTKAIAIAADTTIKNTTTITGGEVYSSDPVRVNDCDSCLTNALDTYGVYVSLRCTEANSDHNDDPSKQKVVFWIFGGAFLAGDVEGNMGCAEKIATQCGANAVFLANYRLAPEYNLQDAYDDVYQSYHKLLSTYCVSPKNIIVYGISSGTYKLVRITNKLLLNDAIKPSLRCIPMLCYTFYLCFSI